MTVDDHEKMLDIVARDCVAVRARIMNRVITRIYDESLRPFGLKVSQMNILVVAGKLVLARPADVCRILYLDASTLSRNVDRMRTKGWLEIVPENDGRAHPFRLTGMGKELLQKAFPAWERAQQKARDVLGSGGLELLQRLSKNAEMQA